MENRRYLVPGKSLTISLFPAETFAKRFEILCISTGFKILMIC